ncbi:hypothetical protein R80B4_00980 [Fibrobacteres bacterium R8-0-B4]
MSVRVDRDCVTLDNGTMLCWDRCDKSYYLYHKKKVEADELSPKDLTKLVAHLSEQRKET